MLAKVIVHAPTRVEAARRLALVLERMTLAGVTTNRDFLVATLRHPAFLAGDTHTDFIEKYQPVTRFSPTDEELDTALAAVALWSQARNRTKATVLSFMRSGYRNSVMPPQELRFTLAGGEATDPVAVQYRSQRDSSFTVTTSNGADGRRAVVVGADSASVTIELDGLRSTHQVIAVGKRWHVQSRAGAVDLIEIPRFPEVDGGGVAGGQTAPMPGVIRAVAVAVGDHVETGQSLVVMEAMKMEHTIRAPEASVVAEVRCSVGDQVTNGAVLVVLDPLD